MGWRAKFVCLLVVYFAGFVTAIYCLAPAPDAESGQLDQANSAYPRLNSNDVARSVNAGVHKCIAFGKQNAVRVAEMIQEKVEEARSRSSDEG
jgi:hypothetical protein